MKKIPFSLIFLWILIFPILIHASWEQGIDAQIDASKFAEESKNIQNVEVNFCDNNNNKQINYDIYAWKQQDICYNIFNGSDKDVTVNIWFVDGFLTNDQWKNRACGNPENITNFGQYVTGYQTQIKLKSGSVKKVNAELRYPKEMTLSGNTIEWCLVYNLSADTTGKQTAVWFDILVRRAKFITLHVKKAPIIDGYLLLYIALFIAGLTMYLLKFHKKTSKWK